MSTLTVSGCDHLKKDLSIHLAVNTKEDSL